MMGWRIAIWLLSISLFGQILPIEQARQQPLGSSVTVSGIVTVANQFGNPAFIQDATGGLAIYDRDFIRRVQIGDSVVIRGTLQEFGAIPGQPQSGLLELVNVTVLAHQRSFHPPDTVRVTLSALDESLEGRLIRLDSVFWTFLWHDRFPDSSRNYGIFDPTGSGELRVDANTALSGWTIPKVAFALVGILSQYRGRYQIQPRFRSDFQPLPSRPIARRLAIISWNLNWFGSSEKGPANDSLQFVGVQQLIDSLDGDIYVLQEIADPDDFWQLVIQLPDYEGFLAPFEASLKTGYIVKTGAILIDTLDLVFTAVPSDAWGGGRYPFRLVFWWQGQRYHLLNLHMKAGIAPDDYQRRWRDAQILANGLWKDSLIIVGGDWNDDIDHSIVAGHLSPYQQLTQDSSLVFADWWLSQRGVATHRSGAMLEHFLVSRALQTTVDVVFPPRIEHYLAKVSDHFPLRLWLHPPAQPTTVFDPPSPSLIRMIHRTIVVSEPGQLRLFSLAGKQIGCWTTPAVITLPPSPRLVIYEFQGRRGMFHVEH